MLFQTTAIVVWGHSTTCCFGEKSKNSINNILFVFALKYTEAQSSNHNKHGNHSNHNQKNIHGSNENKEKEVCYLYKDFCIIP